MFRKKQSKPNSWHWLSSISSPCWWFPVTATFWNRLRWQQVLRTMPQTQMGLHIGKQVWNIYILQILNNFGVIFKFKKKFKNVCQFCLDHGTWLYKAPLSSRLSTLNSLCVSKQTLGIYDPTTCQDNANLIIYRKRARTWYHFFET